MNQQIDWSVGNSAVSGFRNLILTKCEWRKAACRISCLCAASRAFYKCFPRSQIRSYKLWLPNSLLKMRKSYFSTATKFAIVLYQLGHLLTFTLQPTLQSITENRQPNMALLATRQLFPAKRNLHKVCACKQLSWEWEFFTITDLNVTICIKLKELSHYRCWNCVFRKKQ